MSENRELDHQGSSPLILSEKNAYYCGTTKGKSWWRRYMGEGWLSRGNCEMWVDREGLHFRLYLTKKIMTIHPRDVTEITVGKWHAGKFTGAPIIKVTWKKGGQERVSGFSVSKTMEDTDRWVAVLRDCMSK